MKYLILLLFLAGCDGYTIESCASACHMNNGKMKSFNAKEVKCECE